MTIQIDFTRINFLMFVLLKDLRDVNIYRRTGMEKMTQILDEIENVGTGITNV